MSLEGKKSKPYFRKSKWAGVPKGITRLVRTEIDDEGKEVYDQFNIPTKVLHEADPIDLWTHEYSEDAILKTQERDKLPIGEISRYSEKDGKLYRHPGTAAHSAVSHHTDSSLEREGTFVDLTPEQYKDFFWDTGKLLNMYPRIKEFENKWKAISGMILRASRIEEKRQIVKSLKETRRDAAGNVPQDFLNKMDEIINTLESGIKK
jgi:hypothetical protein